MKSCRWRKAHSLAGPRVVYSDAGLIACEERKRIAAVASFAAKTHGAMAYEFGATPPLAREMSGWMTRISGISAGLTGTST